MFDCEEALANVDGGRHHAAVDKKSKVPVRGVLEEPAYDGCVVDPGDGGGDIQLIPGAVEELNGDRRMWPGGSIFQGQKRLGAQGDGSVAEDPGLSWDGCLIGHALPHTQGQRRLIGPHRKRKYITE
jgi:hypothetical protein